MLASARASQPLPPVMCMLYLATARCRLAVGPGTRWSAQAGRLFGGQQAAGPELGGERGPAHGSPGPRWLGGGPAVAARHAAQVGFREAELAPPAGGRAEAQLRYAPPGLVALPGGPAQGPFEKPPGLGRVTGVQRTAAQPRQGVGRLRPQAEVFGHAQAVPVQPGGLLAVPGRRQRRAEPLARLQLPPPVTELPEPRQALPGVAVRGRRVAPDDRQLGAGAQRRGRAPPVGERPEAGPLAADHGFGDRRVAVIRRDEGVEPLQYGPRGGVVDAVEGRRGSVAAAPAPPAPLPR